MLIGAVLALAILSPAMAAAALIAERTRRSGFIDGIWALSTGLAAVLAIVVSGEAAPRAALVAALAAVWALRLGRHLIGRGFADAADDPRYAALRVEWGAAAARRLVVFLQVQALAGWLLAVSAAAAATRGGSPDWRDGLGLAVALMALVGEAVADRTLSAFRREVRGGVCDRGLWGWSRHPNYFFEWLFWVGIAAIGLGGFDGRTALALLAPVVMYGLLVHVSGIPPLERHMRASRGQAFAAYAARVPAFFPRPPRSDQADSQRDSAR